MFNISRAVSYVLNVQRSSVLVLADSNSVWRARQPLIEQLAKPAPTSTGQETGARAKPPKPKILIIADQPMCPVFE